MATTPSSALRYPVSGDAATLWTYFQNLATDLDRKVLPAFATISARNTAIPSPTQGQACTVAGVLHTHTGSKWTWRRVGTSGVSSDANGVLTIAHGLGAAPTVWGAQIGTQNTEALSSTLRLITWDAATNATNIGFKAYNGTTGAIYGAQPINLHWWAEV